MQSIKVGTKGYFADCLARLRERVSNEEQNYFGVLTTIYSDHFSRLHYFEKDSDTHWTFFYPVKESKKVLTARQFSIISELLDFVNTEHISKEDIVSITSRSIHNCTVETLYYWKMQNDE